MENNETPEDAVLRETLEESGNEAKIDGFLGFQNLQTPGWIALIFQCHHLAGEPTADGSETDRVAYFPMDEMNALPEPIEPWCAWVVRRVLSGQSTSIPNEPDNPYAPKKAFL